MQVDIVAVGIHPDDIELCCSGTLLRMIDQGYSVGLIDLTRGELGTRGSGELRLEEARRSCELMGAKFRENMGFADGFMVPDQPAMIRLIKLLRKYRPKLVLANAPADRHPDHGKGSKFVSEACFFSGLSKIETLDDNGESQERWRPRAVYHYIQDRPIPPSFCVDITPYMEQKLDLIKCFKSQFYDPESKELPSPISSKTFFDLITAKARVDGRHIDVEFAEAFLVERVPGIDDLFDLL